MLDNILSFVEAMPSWQKLSWVLICLIFSWGLEFAAPLFQFQYKKIKHIGFNLVFLACSIIINVVMGLITIGVFNYTAESEFGLLYLFDLPLWAELIITMLLLDFMAQYFVHILLHKVKWMWKFHLVHHSDTKVDATTGTRHHPGDYLMREVFAIGTAFLIGAPLAFYLFYRICTVFFTYLTHANFYLPTWLDKAIALVFISPNMHKFHHHFERPWTDSNYGNMFSFWDRIFGTYVYANPKDIEFGVDTLEDEKAQDFKYQFGLPFNKKIKTDY
jgi:sterol desaturase/sphingolipid hydroxylase (fatty acid hydroxylase superfamily)